MSDIAKIRKAYMRNEKPTETFEKYRDVCKTRGEFDILWKGLKSNPDIVRYIDDPFYISIIRTAASTGQSKNSIFEDGVKNLRGEFVDMSKLGFSRRVISDLCGDVKSKPDLVVDRVASMIHNSKKIYTPNMLWEAKIAIFGSKTVENGKIVPDISKHYNTMIGQKLKESGYILESTRVTENYHEISVIMLSIIEIKRMVEKYGIDGKVIDYCVGGFTDNSPTSIKMANARIQDIEENIELLARAYAIKASPIRFMATDIVAGIDKKIKEIGCGKNNHVTELRNRLKRPTIESISIPQ